MKINIDIGRFCHNTENVTSFVGKKFVMQICEVEKKDKKKGLALFNGCFFTNTDCDMLLNLIF